MKNCSKCGAKMIEKPAETPEGFEYTYYKCSKCGEEIIDMKQLRNIAEKYRIMKKYRAKLSKWGLSLGIRIPKELVNKYGLNEEDEVSIIPEKNGFLIINEKQY
ncbi:AbrB/MazE/SpoVT family DNA-binding domain-containing protein [Candidatus Woesearchaeota archaeon]|nr:AbrB/MazE/SpoVT family DNA-binding domain-containing protein [Candidatus Woesearchaeota archaeon]